MSLRTLFGGCFAFFSIHVEDVVRFFVFVLEDVIRFFVFFDRRDRRDESGRVGDF